MHILKNHVQNVLGCTVAVQTLVTGIVQKDVLLANVAIAPIHTSVVNVMTD